MLCIALKSVGYEVIEAETAEAGLTAFVRQQPELVILDLGLTDGALEIDLSRRLVMLHQQQVELTPKEYAVLAMLARHPNCVITQTQLLEQVWGPSHKEDSHYLRIVISHLRQKLGDDPTEPHYLKTEAGIGYRLVLG